MHKVFFIVVYVLLSFAYAANIRGTISSTDGKTPAQTTITALDITNNQNYTTTTNGNEYSLQVPDSIMVEVSAVATDKIQVSRWVVPGYFPATTATYQLNTGNTTVDLSFEKCYTLVLEEYNSSGDLLSFEDYTVFTWISDNNGSPIKGSKSIIYDINNNTTIGLSIPLNIYNIIINKDTYINGYSYIILTIDNEGYGYGSNVSGGYIINVNYELARTSISRVYNKNNNVNYPSVASQAIINMNNILSSTYINNIDLYNKTTQIIIDSLYYEELLESSRASSSDYHTSNITVMVTDQNGGSYNDLTIEMTQVSEDFSFGVVGGNYHINTSSAWKSLIDIGINSATVDFWWSSTESTIGVLDNSDVISERISYLLSLGLKLRATGLFQPSSSILPEYANGLDFTSFSQALKDHITLVVSTYCKQFDMIEVSTDLNILAYNLGFTEAQIYSLQQISLSAIKSAAPGVRTSITTSNQYIPNGQSWIVSESSLSFINDCISSGTSVDQIGLSIYNGVDAEPQYTLGELSDILETQNSLSIPLRVSEFTIPLSVPINNRDDYMKQFYQIAYSKSNVAEITWASLLSSSIDNNTSSVGLFDNNMNPTSLFTTLKNIISSLKSSSSSINIDNNGYGNIKPNGGVYNINIIKNGSIIGTYNNARLYQSRSSILNVLYNDISNTASVSINSASGVVVGVLPSPVSQSSTSSLNNIKSLPAWSVFLIVFGTLIVFAGIATMVILLVLKRSNNRNDMMNSTVDIETSIPVGNVVTRSKEYNNDSNNNVINNNNNMVSPDTWTEGPLATTTITLEDEEENNNNEDKSNGNSSTDSDSDDMEDVQLDEEDVDTSSSSSETDEEHL